MKQRKPRHYPELVAAEADVAEMFATFEPEVRSRLDRLPRDLEAIVNSVHPTRVEYVHDLTMEKIDAILRERHGVVLDASELDEAEKVGGFVYADENRAVIFVETKYNDYYARFTLAHELAHLWLEYICPTLRTGQAKGAWKVRDGSRCIKRLADDPESVLQDGYPPNESAANAFAAALLMPREEVLRVLEREIDADVNYWDAIANIQSRFDTSDWALAFRLYELGQMSWDEYVRVREYSKALASGADLNQCADQDSSYG